MRVGFLDEEGIDQKQNHFDWIIVNTRETLHTRDFVDSWNLLILWRFLSLKKKGLQDNFKWKNIKFFFKKSIFLTTGICLKTRDEYLEKIVSQGFVTFEEVIKEKILTFAGKDNFQAIFVFENRWIRFIQFEGKQIISSRLTALNTSLTSEIDKADFIICDEKILPELPSSISSKDFGEKIGVEGENLKDIITKIHFWKNKKILIPSPSKNFSYGITSFHGKKQILNLSKIAFLCAALWGIYFYADPSSQIQDLDIKISSLKTQIIQDSALKTKQEFLNLFHKNKWQSLISPLSLVKKLGSLPEKGFHLIEFSYLNQNFTYKISMSLKPNEDASQDIILTKFSDLKSDILKPFGDATLTVSKPPFGVLKKNSHHKLPTSTAQIEILLRQK
jgi:hypothetical protein